MNQELQTLLYTDSTGEVVGLDEVQLLEEIPTERIPRLQYFLSIEQDKYVRYQIVLLLVSWGVEEHLADARELIVNDSNIILDEHRYKNLDLRYDKIADALYCFASVKNDVHLVLPLFQLLVRGYPNFYFEGRLQYALEQLPLSPLLDDIRSVYHITFSNGDYFEAAWLVPCIAKYNANLAIPLIESLSNHQGGDYDPMEHCASALKYIHTSWAKELLERLAKSENELVRSKAIESITILMKNESNKS